MGSEISFDPKVGFILDPCHNTIMFPYNTVVYSGVCTEREGVTSKAVYFCSGLVSIHHFSSRLQLKNELDFD